MQKAVLRLDVHDDKEKKKALKTASGMCGVTSISIETKDKTLMTVVGDIDPVCIVTRLRKKICHAEIVSVGPPPKDGDKKKEEPKKEEPKKEDQKKKDGDQTKKCPNPCPVSCPCHPPMVAYLCPVSYPCPPGFRSCVEEDPNACVIC